MNMVNKLTNDDIPDPYQPENVPLDEMIFGKNLISLGGTDAIDNMFSGINLTELKALDLGFGLGGVAFYLAKKFQMEINGIEMRSWMVDHAYKNAPPEIVNQLHFSVYKTDGSMPFAASVFDVVYSKGVLNHVSDKNTLFQQINTVLKPAGLFIIADWVFAEPIKQDNGPLVKETYQSYQQVLENAGFVNIEFRDDSAIFQNYVALLLENLALYQVDIVSQYGKSIFTQIEADYQNLIEEMKTKKKFAVRILAKKGKELT